MTEWIEVRRGSPCPACGHDGWCQISRDGGTVMCRRSPTDREKRDRSGAVFWIHDTGSGVGAASAVGALPVISGTGVPMSSLEHRDRVYRALLGELALTQPHREQLRRRGLPEEEVTARGYRSMPISKEERIRVVNALWELERNGLIGVPGFYQDPDSGRVRLAGSKGLLIPVRDLANRIQALKIRRDSGSPRYVWLSSSSKPGGAGSGAPTHVPLHNRGEISELRITEGPLKADVATVLSGVLTVGIPGIGNIDGALAVVDDLGGEP